MHPMAYIFIGNTVFGVLAFFMHWTSPLVYALFVCTYLVAGLTWYADTHSENN